MYIMHGKDTIIFDDYGYIQLHTNVQASEWDKRIANWLMEWLFW